MADLDLRGLRFDLARVTIELESPLSIGTGAPGDFTDVVCVTDANGLPTIPGSTIAGVLRHLMAAGNDPDHDDVCKQVFGYQERARGAGSALEVSWAHVHDRNDCPLPARAPVRKVGTVDEVLDFIAAGVTRDHVRLNGFGTVDDRGKHDVSAVPVGARFTFEIIRHDGCPVTPAQLVDLLNGPTARFGSGTRRGNGRFKVVRALHSTFDLRKAADRDALARIPRDIGGHIPDGVLQPMKFGDGIAEGFCTGTIELVPEDFWLVGGGAPEALSDVGGTGSELRPLANDVAESVDMAPLTEKRIDWATTPATVSGPRFVLPASAIKGALRHRTAFHAWRLREEWALAIARRANEVPEEVDVLFGVIRSKTEGRPGRLVIDDAWPARGGPMPIDHVSIDRFSGGPLDGHLFREAPLSDSGAIEIAIQLDCRRAIGQARLDDEVGKRALAAFRAALDDLCQGRLALGGGASRGHGYFKGTVRWAGSNPLEEDA